MQIEQGCKCKMMQSLSIHTKTNNSINQYPKNLNTVTSYFQTAHGKLGNHGAL